MRPTHTDFRSPKNRTGEYTYPKTTFQGNKIFNSFVPAPLRVSIKPALNNDILSNDQKTSIVINTREKRHTSFGNEPRFLEVKVSLYDINV